MRKFMKYDPFSKDRETLPFLMPQGKGVRVFLCF